MTRDEREVIARLVSNEKDTGARSKFYIMHHIAMMRKGAGAPR